jgi:16S rRNA (cytosine967-C5)-methyltransferase
MGAYQLLDLERIPAAAATSEAVALASRWGHTGTARLVNAVLRRLAAEGASVPPQPSTDPLGHLAVVYSHPRWLVSRWLARWGHDEATRLLAVNLEPAPSALRANTLRITRDALIQELHAIGIEASPSLTPEAIRVRGSLTGRLALAEQGLCLIQDEGAMLVAHAVAPSPGQTVIDACAAPGGKATHLAALMGNTGRVLACDIHPRKLEALVRRAATLGATGVEAHQMDAREIGRAWPDRADAVLVDAPCSGLGTIRRRPEIKWRAKEDDLPRHAAMQQTILAGASGAVRAGGVLVYSVCSLEPEEGPEVVRAFLSAHPEFVPTPLPETFPRTVGGSSVDHPAAGEVYLLPHRHDTDGFYVARLQRR